MSGIQGIGGVPEPRPGGPSRTREERENEVRQPGSAGQSGGSQDDVTISSEAQAAAEVSRLVRLSGSEQPVRSERVEAARERLEQGSFRDPEVVSQVADRLLRFLE